MEENKSSKKRIGVIDVAIIILLILSIVGVAMRFLLVKNSPKNDEFYDLPSEKYLVSFLVREKRFEYAEHMKKGAEFRFGGTNNPFGELAEDVTYNNAEKWYSDGGKSYMVKNEGADDHQLRYDIYGSFIVEGKMNDSGLLSINDSNSADGVVALYSSIGLRSDDMVINVTVTGISPYNSAD